MASGYRPRIADAELRACLAAAGAVVIEGQKACGKTRMAQQVTAPTVLLDVDTVARQVEPALWNQVRRAVDVAAEPGQFLLTGSALPADDAERHTGAGRCSFLRLRPEPKAPSTSGCCS